MHSRLRAEPGIPVDVRHVRRGGERSRSPNDVPNGNLAQTRSNACAHRKRARTRVRILCVRVRACVRVSMRACMCVGVDARACGCACACVCARVCARLRVSVRPRVPACVSACCLLKVCYACLSALNECVRAWICVRVRAITPHTTYNIQHGASTAGSLYLHRGAAQRHRWRRFALCWIPTRHGLFFVRRRRR